MIPRNTTPTPRAAMTPTEIRAEIQKLSPKPGDILVFRAGTSDDLEALLDGRLSWLCLPHVSGLVLAPETTVELMDDDVMAANGWQRIPGWKGGEADGGAGAS